MKTRKPSFAEPLLGIDPAGSEKNVVQKSAPLLALWRSSLSLAEFKILDAYLARIDSHHPERRWVRFSKGDLERLLGVQKINAPDLRKRIEHLSIMVNVEDFDEVDGFHSVALFEEAMCKRDQHGLWQVDLRCTEGAMKYVFNVENLGYLRYKLRSIINLNSRYSYLLFMYIERNRFRETWQVSLDELREFLGCTDPSYQQYKYFNREILKRCQKELEEKTPCRFTYSGVRLGRQICAVEFVVQSIDDDSFFSQPVESHTLPAQSEQSHLDEVEQLEENAHFSNREFVMSACMPINSHQSEFSDEQQSLIWAILPMIPLSKMPNIDMVGPASSDIYLRWYHYLAEKYAELNQICSQRPISNRFAYLLRMLKIDAGI